MELYETKENLKNVRDKYFEAFEKLKSQEKIEIIDGNQTPEKIAEDIWEKVCEISE
jgi:dTMP kinase